MKKIRVGGVPEHFNLPWHLGIENKKFEQAGLELTWKDFPDGTGAMCKALRENEIDVSVILTEGIIKDILAGNKAKIVQEYIASPLIWGIHVAAAAKYENLEDLEKEKVAISRFGSGSHLMAFVNAKRLGWDIDRLDFEVVRDIDGAVDSLKNGNAGYFMWEYFTTKPLVDKGIFRRIGDCPTPWPCFVIAVREGFLKENEEAVHKMLSTLNRITRDFKEIPGIEKQLAERYEQKVEDITEWLKITEWSQEQISEKEIERVQNELKNLGLIERTVIPSELIHDLTK